MATGGSWRELALGMLLLAALSWGGCSQYVDGFAYAPQPALVNIASSNPKEAPPAATLASVVGVRRADSDAHLPAAVQVRLRIESTGALPVTFDPASLQLTTGFLEAFPPPTVQPPGPLTVPPGQAQMVEVFFPFPPGRSYDNLPLDTLRLRWVLGLGNQAVPESTTFTRIVPVYYYNEPYYFGGYYGPYYPYGGHRHWR